MNTFRSNEVEITNTDGTASTWIAYWFGAQDEDVTINHVWKNSRGGIQTDVFIMPLDQAKKVFHPDLFKEE